MGQSERGEPRKIARLEASCAGSYCRRLDGRGATVLRQNVARPGRSSVREYTALSWGASSQPQASTGSATMPDRCRRGAFGPIRRNRRMTSVTRSPLRSGATPNDESSLRRRQSTNWTVANRESQTCRRWNLYWSGAQLSPPLPCNTTVVNFTRLQ